MTERTDDPEPGGAPVRSPAFRWDLALLGSLLGAVVCAVGYWPANADLRDALDVQSFPPRGGTYWLCWLLPLAVVAAVVGVLLVPRSSRPFASGFLAGLLLVGIVMCAFGYSVDSMPFYM
ncbi:hypothetical protein [Rhodococcus sp. ACT016]|uniref:hypothetical protein n=1 Tax=Rhodococcus sp. ACT016 TaxID=3134808 RepID=UPI003D2D3745